MKTANLRFVPFWLLLFAALLSGCDDAEQRLSLLSGPSMGTTWSVKFTGTPEGGIPALKGDIEKALVTVNHEMSTYQSDSDLSRFNQAPAGSLVTLPPDFA
ncbi:MAG: FAD:protein FMN transferase, partial [Alcanivorax sp.]|nr:FAD:protein FMN transferase [Alcanivorax sp.]